MLNRIRLASLLNTIFYEKVDCLKLPPDGTGLSDSKLKPSIKKLHNEL